MQNPPGKPFSLASTDHSPAPPEDFSGTGIRFGTLSSRISDYTK